MLRLFFVFVELFFKVAASFTTVAFDLFLHTKVFRHVFLVQLKVQQDDGLAEALHKDT